MSHREFVEWKAYYDLKGRITDIRARHPKWSMGAVLDWAEAQISLRKKK